ncbi:tetratricopeptide repeat protein [Curtobacterium sp. ER1/6]|uniref:tetratricopeptide repeat protein n=1 Tax=Curtobacterium sp. ER1/6 TaxID=1891920 RepID=UPI00084FB711|nr:tetratricopeptide repeat protein [Curtobacterium sp. ER1/6]OEI69474.1 co-chaperone YbbN [Curtobacterium sp. ER1/6]
MTNVPPTPSGLRGAVDLSSLVDRAQRPAQPGPASTAGGQPGTAPTGAAPAGAPAAGDLTVPSLVLDVTDQTFQDVLQLSSVVPVIVDIWAEWCGPCKQLSPILERLTAEYDGRVVLAKVDADTNPQLVQAFQAQSIPTVAAVIGGRPLGLFVGALPEAEVRDVFEQVVAAAEQNGVTGRVTVDGASAAEPVGEPEPEPLPPHHQAAYDAIERGDYAAAVQEYRTAIAQDPNDQMAVAGLAQVSLLARLDGRTADELRSAAASAPQDVEAQMAVADLDVSGGHVEDAFGRLLDLVPTVFGAEREALRVRLVEYFELIGVDDPRVAVARRRLASALY